MWNKDDVSDKFCESMFDDMSRDFNRYMLMWATFARVAKENDVVSELNFLIAFYGSKIPSLKPKGLKKAVLSVLTSTYLLEESPEFFFAPGVKGKNGKAQLTKSNIRRIIRHCKSRIFPVIKEIIMGEPDMMKKFFALKKQELKQTSSFLVRVQINPDKEAQRVNQLINETSIKFELSDQLEVKWNAPLKCF
jgi:hypothetical protein